MLWFVVAYVVGAEPSVAQLQKQCEASKASACRELGLALAADKTVDLRPAYAAYARGCQLQDAPSCNFAGVLLVDGVGLARDVVEAERLFHLACEKGVSRGCLNEGLVLRSQGRDPTTPLRRAYDLAKPACESGEQPACRDMLRASDTSPKTILPPEEVSRVATRSCNLGADWACGQLALAYLFGYGLKPDPAEAKRLGSAACAKNERNGCEVMALVAFKASEWAEALRTGTIACDAEHPLACYAKGTVLMGKGSVTADPPKAADALETSCLNGYSEACVMLFAFAPRLKIEGARLKRVEDLSCQADRPAACKRVLERSEAPPPQLLELALESVCKNASGPFSEPKAGAAACQRLAALREARGDSKLAWLYATSCQTGQLEACEKVVKAPDAKDEERVAALRRLCRPEGKQWCLPLVREFDRAPPAEASAFIVPLALACMHSDGPECARLEAAVRTLTKDRSSVREELDDLCSPPFPSVCRAAEAVSDGASESGGKLCASGDLDACARLPAGEPVVFAWGLARQCKGGRAAACSALAAKTKPEWGTSLPFAHFLAAAWVASLGEPKSAQLPDFKCAQSTSCMEKQFGDAEKKRVARWFSSLPRDATLRRLREAELCSWARSLGVPPSELAVPLRHEIYAGDSSAEFTVDGHALPLDQSSADVEVCASGWEVGTSRSTYGSGDLELEESGLRFKPVRWGEEPPPQWRPEGGFGVGLELLAGIPPAGKDFIDDTGTFSLRVGFQRQEPITYLARASLVLPVGLNPFGLTIEFGGSFGALFTNVVRWRPLQAVAAVWFSFPKGDPRILLVPTLSTSLDFALGQQQLSLDVGAKLPFTLGGINAQLPLELTVAPFAGLTFTPTF